MQNTLKAQVLEIHHQGNCIEQRVYSPPNLLIPGVGEHLTILFNDPGITDQYGSEWIVRERKYIFARTEDQAQTIQLYCDPLD